MENVTGKEKSKKELCSICGNTFVFKVSLKNHMKKIHNVFEDNNKGRIICSYEECNSKFRTYQLLQKHLLEDHHIDLEFKELNFQSENDFQAWKESYEKKELVRYVMDTSKKVVSNGVKSYYQCHRSYTYRDSGKNLRAIKSMGSNKIAKACPSRLEILTKSDGTVSGKFCTIHVGHKIDVGRTLLSKQQRLEIADKIKQGINFQRILDNIRQSEFTEEGLQRIHLLEKRDIYNITRDFNITYNTKLHDNDSMSVRLWVHKMQALDDECPVLHYKEQGQIDPLQILAEEDFLLIIMTSFQAQQLRAFGHDKICIDGTHGTNAYDINLYTLMTIDEFSCGCPIAFCFSNRADEVMFKVFFEQVKLKVGVISTKVFMSDDAPAFYNAWCSTMSPATHRLLCIWHVDRNWQQNLNKVSGGAEKKALVYKTLKVLMQLTCPEKFQHGLTQVLRDFFSDPETLEFGKYFQTYYANRPEMWAYCFRLGLQINTNMYLESFHKVLKHVYLEGKKVKRLDKTVDALMKITRDSLFKRLIKLAKNTPSDRIKQIKQSHRVGCGISASDIELLKNKQEWLVLSQSNPLQQYHIVKIEEQCKMCNLKCTDCNICIHDFKCSCIDNVIKFNICKHIHACAMSITSKAPQNCTFFDSEIETKLGNVVKEIQVSTSSHLSTYSENIALKVQLIQTLNNSNKNLTEEENLTIVRKLDEILSIYNKKENNVEIKHNINTKQKIEKQVRFFSTKRKRKTTQRLAKPTILEINAITAALVEECDHVLNISTVQQD